MAAILNRFAKTLKTGEAEMLEHVRAYADWQTQRQDRSFRPEAGDDVALRTYLLDRRNAGAPRAALKAEMAALKRFYAWAVAHGFLESSPFEDFNLDRPTLPREQIRRRQDRLGVDSQARELARLRALQRLTEQLNKASDLQTALDVALQTLVETMGLHTAWAFLWDESGLTAYFRHGPAPHDFVLAAACALPPALEAGRRRHLRQPPDCWCQWLLRAGRLKRAVNIVECTRLQDAAEDAGDTAGLLFHASLPVLVQGRPVGLINIAAEAWQFFTAGDLQLLNLAGTHIAAAVERAGLFARSRELGVAEERNRLAREIHDTLAQRLTALTLQLETADALLDTQADPARTRAVVQHALDLARAGLDEARRSVLDLRAAPLEARTLPEALEALAREAPQKPRVTFRLQGPAGPLPPRVEAALYRIAQEALYNVRRHARARRATLRLQVAAEAVRLIVDDDGAGFDPAQVPEGRHGLISMNERARLAGGQLHLESAPGRGTRVEVNVPLPKDARP